MRNFLGIALENRTQNIGLWLIIKNDFLPWFLSAGFALLLFLGVRALVGSAQPNMDDLEVSANLYTWVLPLYYALIALAVLLARRSRDAQTWVLIVILAIFFVGQGSMNFSIAILPNSILYAMVAMIGLLAFSRIVEYIHLKYIVKLDEPRLTCPAYVAYVFIVISTLLANSSIFYSLLHS